MGHKHDFWEHIRHSIVPKIGLLAQFIEDVSGNDYYVESEIHNEQFVGRVAKPLEQFEKDLHEMGFSRNPLASWKTLDSTDEQENGSWRKVGYDDYPEWQLHVVLYDGAPIDNPQENVTYVYAHWEKRWDTNPIEHYRGIEKSGPEGVRQMKKHLDERGLTYEPIRP